MNFRSRVVVIPVVLDLRMFNDRVSTYKWTLGTLAACSRSGASRLATVVV